MGKSRFLQNSNYVDDNFMIEQLLERTSPAGLIAETKCRRIMFSRSYFILDWINKGALQI